MRWMSVLRSTGFGIAAGLIGTLAHTAMMLGAQKIGAVRELPPRTLTRRMLSRLTGSEPSEPVVDVAAAVNHFGYGASVGAVFGLAGSRIESRALRVAAGIGTGLAVWAVSYAGWIPALSLMPHAKHDSRGRQGALVLGHLLYGAALGLFTPSLRAKALGGTDPRRVERGEDRREEADEDRDEPSREELLWADFYR
jgi:hypothetical protein